MSEDPKRIVLDARTLVPISLVITLILAGIGGWRIYAGILEHVAVSSREAREALLLSNAKQAEAINGLSNDIRDLRTEMQRMRERLDDNVPRSTMRLWIVLLQRDNPGMKFPELP